MEDVNHTQKSLPQVKIQRVKVNELRSKDLDENYIILQQVGSGTYGQVHKACSKTDPNKYFALKHLNTSKETEGFPITAMREMKILQKLDHENILKIREVVTKQIANTKNRKYQKIMETYIVLDYMEHDFQGLLKKKTQYTESQVKCLIQQLLLGMNHLHSNNIIHRDLKSANLLLNGQGILKIADFGFARNIEKPLSRPLTPIVVTLWYRAPEILLGNGIYNEKSDCWSIGCFMAELLFLEPLLRGAVEKKQVELIFKHCGTPTENSWPGVTSLRNWDELKPDQAYDSTLREFLVTKLDEHKIDFSDMGLDFISKLMIVNPENRLSTQEALDHPYFKTEPLPCHPSELPVVKEECHEQLMNREKKIMTRNTINEQDYFIPHSQRRGGPQNRNGMSTHHYQGQHHNPHNSNSHHHSQQQQHLQQQQIGQKPFPNSTQRHQTQFNSNNSSVRHNGSHNNNIMESKRKNPDMNINNSVLHINKQQQLIQSQRTAPPIMQYEPQPSKKQSRQNDF